VVSPEQVGERYLSVHQRMRRAVDDGMSGSGLSLARTKVLVQLRQRGPTRQSVLAVEFGCAPHSITDIVDALERAGLAVRRADPTDRRAKLVALTSAGEAALAVASATRERLLKQIFGALDAGERATMVRLLDALDGAAAALSSPLAAALDSEGIGPHVSNQQRAYVAAGQRPPLADPGHCRYRSADGGP
jgi:DNA-binding MarR family transcriptional regulator